MGILVSPMVVEMEVDVVEGPTTLPEAAREEIALVEPTTTTEVVVPPTAVEIEAKMVVDSTT